MKNYFLLFSFLFISVHSLFAVPAVPWAVEKIQPDGTKISVYLKGDENVHWMESADGYTLMCDAQKYVVYAQTDVQGSLTPSNIKFGSSAKPNANITKGLRYSKAQINTLTQIGKMTKNATTQRAVTGNVKRLCIMAAFSNRAFVKTNAEFDALMNQVGYSVGGAKGSVRDYYLENSYGLMDIEITVVGPVTVSQTTSYYATRGYEFGDEVATLVDPLIDYSQFATNGEVESFHIIFAGYGDEAINNQQQIWSHARFLNNVIKDGMKLPHCSCSPELRGSSGSDITRIGVIAHEMGHGFGSPDYYDINNIYPGSGYWDLMGNGSWNDGGRRPASINPYQKIRLGWITPEILTKESSVSNMPPSASDPVVYKVIANIDGEHYLLENRQYVGFDLAMPGHGLLIWHIHRAVDSVAVPNFGHPLKMYPICASSTTTIPNDIVSSYGNINSAGCPFPGTSGKTEFTNNSIPQAFTWEGLTSICMLITNITENTNQTVSFLCGAQVVNFHNQTVATDTAVIGCEVNVQGVTINSGANVAITGNKRVEITSLAMEDGSSLVVNNGTSATQSSASPFMASRAVTEETLVEAGEAPEENAIAPVSTRTVPTPLRAKPSSAITFPKIRGLPGCASPT